MPDLILVHTTIADPADAQRIATQVVERRLAACAQVSGPIESSYWWNARIEKAKEWTLTLKTTSAHYEEIERAILEIHPYDQPEIVATPLCQVTAGYAKWLLAQLKPIGS